MKNILFFLTVFMPFYLPAQVINLDATTTRAVVVGISDYQDEKIPDLRFADRDAEAFAAWLRSPAGGSLPPENVMLLTNKKATNGQIISAIDWLMAVSKKDDRAIIYFSGHGDVETNTVRNLGFLLTYDSPPNSYLAGAYPIFYLQVVMETLADKGVQATLVADACHAGKLAGSEIAGTQVTAQNLANQFAKEAKIMSCQPNEFSLEGEQWGGGRGAFSYHLLEGLHGLADADDDRQVTLREIGRYLEDRVAKETAPHRQLPYTVGDPYRLLANVDGEALASLKERKQHELTALDKIETKGLEELLLAAVDSGIQEMYARFTAALEAGDLLEPKDSSAYGLYLQLSQIDTLKALHGLMRRNLAAAFQDDAQQAINAYMQADSSEINSLYRKDKRYFQYPVYLEKAAELLGPEHYAYNSVMCKKYYFEGIVKTLDIPDPNKKDSLYRESIQLLNKALEYEDRAAYVHKVLGDRYSTLKSEKCLEYYDKATQLAPDWVMPWYAKGRYYHWTLRQYENAEPCYQHSLKLDSTYVWAWYALGQLYLYGKTDTDKAEAMFAKALSLDSSHIFVPVFLAQLYAYFKRDMQGGIAIIKRHQKWHPDFFMYHHQLGLYYELIGDLELAEQAYEKALELNPADFNSITALTLLHILHSRFDEAEELSKKGLQLDSTQVESWQILAHIYTRTERYDQAEYCLKRGLSLDSLGPGLLEEMGYLRFRQGNLTEAAQWCLKQISISGALSFGWDNMYMSFIRFKEGQTEEAFMWLEKSVQLGIPYLVLVDFPDLAPLRARPEWKALMKKYFPDQFKD